DDGTIEVQGETVEQVLVEGREFFGDDPTVATRGLPADAVERVEVFDQESDMAEFTGIPDGGEELTLNLLLTEDAQQGYFGAVQSALGASERVPTGLSQADQSVRYDEQLGINRFSPSTQLALIGSLNNVSRARFSIGGPGGGNTGGAAALRGGGGAGGGGGGFTQSGILGFNGSYQFSDDDWIRSSYFFSDVATERESDQLQQQLLGSSIASTISNSGASITDIRAHRLDLNAQREFSSGNRLRLRAGLNSSSNEASDVTERLTTGTDGSMLNSESSSTGSDASTLAANANLTWMKRLDDSGRALVVNLGANLREPEESSDLASTTVVAASRPGGGDDGAGDDLTRDILQQRSETGRVFTNSQRVALTQPLGGSQTLELFGLRRDVREDERREVFDVSGATPLPVPDLTSGLDQTYGYYRGGLRLARNTETLRLVLGMEGQRSDLQGTIDGRSESIENGYTHFLPSAELRLQIGESQNVSARYRTTTREPSMQELQPFADNTSPTNVYVGNPDLQPEYTHALQADWRYFDAFTFLNLFTYARLSHTSDDIVSSRTIDDRGFQTVQPLNAGESWTASTGVNFGRPVRPLGINLSIDYGLNWTERPEFVNGAENESRIMGNSLSFQIQNRDKTHFDLTGTARFGFNDVAYSLNDELDQSYMNSSYGVSGTVYLGDAWTAGGDWRYQLYDPDVFGAVENVSLLNLSLSRFLFDEKGSIELAAMDLLNESQVVNFSSSANAISETRTQALGRYLLLRFNYRLGNLGGRGRTGPGGRR
ncbi:MAG: outer membrane beta-barrel family protein, partial [Gemmatimonadetes bacterium]|nr:outer membrane beta-barrel family protein [Gemmatimonadota bacterium]